MTSLHSDGDDSLPPIHRVGGASRRCPGGGPKPSPPGLPQWTGLCDGLAMRQHLGSRYPPHPGGAQPLVGLVVIRGHTREGRVEVTTGSWAEGLSLHFLISKVG